MLHNVLGKPIVSAAPSLQRADCVPRGGGSHYLMWTNSFNHQQPYDCVILQVRKDRQEKSLAEVAQPFSGQAKV